MELFLKTPPKQEPLTIDEVKSYLRISTDQEDSFLLNLIASSRAHVESITGRALLKQQWQLGLKPPYPPSSPLVRRMENHIMIQIPKPPLLEVESVTLKGSDISFIQEENKLILSPLFWEKEITLTYWAGYGETASSLPANLKMAVLMATRFFYDQQPVELPLLKPFKVLSVV